jgi:4-hydroxy-tetrahydrodipicolinate synthase
VAVVGITTGLVERLLAAYPNAIAGMKDSSGDWNNTKTFLDAFAKSGFDVFVGSESFLLAGMRNGGVGTISATANVNPAAIHKLYTEWKNPDADEQQAKLNVVREVLTRDRPIARSRHHATYAVYPTASPHVVFSRNWSMIAALKQAIAIYADDPAWRTVRPPLVELTLEQAKTLAAELKAISFAMPGIGTKAES